VHVVFDDDVSWRFSSAISSARRAVPSLPNPAVGSSRNSSRGRAASATPISRARRSPYDRLSATTRSLPARPTRARMAAPSSCAAVLRPRSRTIEKPCARTEGSAIRMLSSAVSSSNRFMIWNERDTPLQAICRGDKPVMSSPANFTVPRSGL
jgi:hypothetical protein